MRCFCRNFLIIRSQNKHKRTKAEHIREKGAFFIKCVPFSCEEKERKANSVPAKIKEKQKKYKQMVAYLLRSFLFFRCGKAKKQRKNPTQSFNKTPQKNGKESKGKSRANSAPKSAENNKFLVLYGAFAHRKDKAVKAQSSTKFSAKTYSI